MREIICDAIAKENKTSGPLVDLYSYFTDQCEEAFVDEHVIIQGKELVNPADKRDGEASKTSSPFSSVSSDDLLDGEINSSSESDDMRYEALKKAQAAERKGIQQQVQPELKPKTCTIIRLPKPKPQNVLTEDEKKYVAENVGKLDMKNSEGIREVVKNHVTPDADGNMDFELEQLPYEVGKNLYRYIKACLQRQKSNERQRENCKKRAIQRNIEKAEQMTLQPPQQVTETKKRKVEKPVKVEELKPNFSNFTVQQLSEYME